MPLKKFKMPLVKDDNPKDLNQYKKPSPKRSKRRNKKRNSTKHKSSENVENQAIFENESIENLERSVDFIPSCVFETEVNHSDLFRLNFSEFSLYRKPQFSIKYIKPLSQTETLLQKKYETSHYKSSFIFTDFSLYV